MGFRLANRLDRAALIEGTRWWDLETASDGNFGPDPLDAIKRWRELSEQAESIIAAAPHGVLDGNDLRAAIPKPSKILAVGLNYQPHAEESNLVAPEYPMIFPKFPNCVTGPMSTIYLPSGSVDWEVELVLVVGDKTRHVSEADALSSIAGVTVGQDISDRHVQMLGNPPQFGLGKSFDTFGPIGPAIVSLDQIDDVSDLKLWCSINGERVQEARTSELIFPLAYLVSYLSSIVTLEPGDLIFTGTPAGVGMGFQPPRYLQSGDIIDCGIEGIGDLHLDCRDEAQLG